ncbi:hypothetical protein, partial [Streptococcus sanguinis]|uniref:hypothetical protein n=1 Tax=Streptococcus sanguinis TaxID=1305 RepID=UPI001CC139E8
MKKTEETKSKNLFFNLFQLLEIHYNLSGTTNYHSQEKTVRLQSGAFLLLFLNLKILYYQQ